MSPEDIRRQQQEAGKRMTTQSNGKPPYSKPTSSQGPRKPFVAKGHDAYLKEAQDAKAVMSIRTMAGEDFEGVVVARDKFTITLDTVVDRDVIGGTVIRRTFYKHAIESFERVAS